MISFRILSCMVLVGLIAANTTVLKAQANGQGNEIRIGTIELTKNFVSENHLRQKAGPEPVRAKIATMSDADIYKALMEGKLDVGSVLALQRDVGIKNKDFEKAFKTPPKVLTLGHMAVSVYAPRKRLLKQLTVDQVGGIISGKITDWSQLGHGKGKIDVMVDKSSIKLLAAVTGAKPLENLKMFNQGAWVFDKVDNDSLVFSSTYRADYDPSRSSSAGLIPILDAKGRALLPELKAVRNGIYPLARPWRLIVHPDAAKTAEMAVKILSNVEEGKSIDYSINYWFVRPTVSPIPNHIRVVSWLWKKEIVAAAEAYKKIHPEVTITFYSSRGTTLNLLQGDADLMSFQGVELSSFIGRQEAKKYKNLSKKITERIVCYWPLAVAVHPKNTVKYLTPQQLRIMMTNPKARWCDLGRPIESNIHLYIYDTNLVAKALGCTDQKSMTAVSKAVQKHSAGITLPPSTQLPDISSDEDALVIIHYSKKLAAGGYRILPLASSESNKAKAPTDTAAIASGDYFLRDPLKVAILTSAPPHVKNFFDWLMTDEAAKAMKAESEDVTTSPWPLAHVSETGKKTAK